MTCKVRRDFKIITDAILRVSLVTSNICESSICSPKSLYKKTSNEILAELKAVVKTGALKGSGGPRPVIPQTATTDLMWQESVKQPALTHTPSPPRGGGRRNFSSCSDQNRIKMTAIFFPLPSSWSISFLLRTSFFTAQKFGPMVHYYN